MLKDITGHEEMKDLIELYFEFVSIKRLLKELSKPNVLNFSTTEIAGISLSGYFDEDEPEYYGERKVQFCGFQDSIKNEVCGTISFEEFIDVLYEYADKYILENPNDSEEIQDNLKKIKSRLLG